MDNYPTYELLNHYNMLPFIPLDSRTKVKYNYPHLCPGGIPYQNWGYCKPKGIKYRCWFAYHGLEPPNECKCSNSSYGKVIYLKPDHDPKMFTPVPRYSKAFKDKFKTRTSVERSNKRMFVDYSIEHARSRGSIMKFTFTNFDAINIHLDAWISHLNFSLSNNLSQSA